MIFNLMYADVKPFFASGSQTIIHPLIGASFRAEKRQGSEDIMSATTSVPPALVHDLLRLPARVRYTTLHYAPPGVADATTTASVGFV
eukprot:539329-Prorocentrum_minimum.AAC.1